MVSSGADDSGDRRKDATVLVGGSQLFLGAASYESAFSSPNVVPSPRNAPSITGGGANAMASSNQISSQRLSQLAEGASPSSDAEQGWVQRYSAAMTTTIGAVTALVSEGQRQASLGRDIFGRSLNAREDNGFEQRVLDLVNVERAKYGLHALGYDQRLDLAAERHNAQQAATNTMAHDGIGDGDPGERIKAVGFNNAWGENVATGQLSPEQVVAEWMASPGHRRNILDADYDLLGVSYTTGPGGRTYWAQSFGSSD